jgi:predicted DNA-binding antitoxin AbrB/MazE fold protein
MEKTIMSPLTKVNFQEGINRVIEMYDDVYSDMINDTIVELMKCNVKTDIDDITILSDYISCKNKERKDIIKVLRQCTSFCDLIEFTENDGVFEGSEEILIGAFLEQQIYIQY